MEKKHIEVNLECKCIIEGIEQMQMKQLNIQEKGDLKGYGSKAFKEYEKNMDPKKRQALKDKATKGMKFTHERNFIWSL